MMIRRYGSMTTGCGNWSVCDPSVDFDQFARQRKASYTSGRLSTPRFAIGPNQHAYSDNQSRNEGPVPRFSRTENLVHHQDIRHGPPGNHDGGDLRCGRVSSEPMLELLAPAQLNIVCFRYRSHVPDTTNAEIVAALHESGVAAPSVTTIHGKLAIRAAIFNHRTVREDVDTMIDEVLRLQNFDTSSGHWAQSDDRKTGEAINRVSDLATISGPFPGQ